MNEITGLVPVKRRSGWTEVQLDGVSLCRIPDEDVHRLRLDVGLTLGSAELDAVQAAGGRAEAMFVGLRYLSVRPRSRREVERRLWRDRIDQAAIRHALERLAALGYLDDAQFAASFARDRIRLRPCGTRRMQSDPLPPGGSPGGGGGGGPGGGGGGGGVDPSKARRRLFDYLARRGFAAGSVRAWIEVNWQAEADKR